MNLDNISNQIYVVAVNEAKLQKHEYVTPEHFLYASLMFDAGKDIIEAGGGNIKNIVSDLQEYFKKNMTLVENEKPIESYAFIQMFELASKQVNNSSKDEISLGNLIITIFSLKNSYASYILEKNNVNRLSILRYISHGNQSAKKVSSTDRTKQRRELEFLNKFSVNLTESAKKGELDPVVGREDVMNRTIQVLSRRLKNNPIHVGHPGVGKTSIIEGLAQRIAEGLVPPKLIDAEVYHIDMGAVLAGTKYRGDFEERLLKILEIISKLDNPIVYFDEIHTVVGAGSVSGGGMDATGIIKPYLQKGRIKFVGSTTYDEYKKIFEKDRALSRRFQRIDIEEPSIEECIEILMGIKSKYEDYHNVFFSDDIIESICTLTDKYLNDRYLPDKAIDAMDETGAYVNINNLTEERIDISQADIERTISLIAKVPTKTVSTDDLEKLKVLDAELKKSVFGQDEAINEIVNSIKLSRAGLREEFKPISSMLFVGPTGVGKTEIAKNLSETLGLKLIRYDMSEYQEKHSVSRLIGSPPGYVGYEEGGMLTDEIRRTPYCVLLLDEIEKAHQDILNVLLQVMDYGTLTDNLGKKADFNNVIIIMTSNAGARNIGKKLIGFEEKVLDNKEIDQEVEKVFSPEFRNRLDSIITFNHINEEMSYLIAEKALNELSDNLSKKDIVLKYSEELLSYIASKGLSDKYGAREIQRVVNTDIKKLIVENVLFGEVRDGGILKLEYEDGEISIVELEEFIEPLG